MDFIETHLVWGWAMALLGVVSGALLGLGFHRDGFAGGYGSFQRRMLRLGHISFFGLGFLNLFFAFTLDQLAIHSSGIRFASMGFRVGAIAMPLCCFLSAWKKPFRRLFPIPVAAVTAGVCGILIGHLAR